MAQGFRALGFQVALSRTGLRVNRFQQKPESCNIDFLLFSTYARFPALIIRCPVGSFTKITLLKLKGRRLFSKACRLFKV